MIARRVEDRKEPNQTKKERTDWSALLLSGTMEWLTNAVPAA